MTILITGITGFLGSHLSDILNPVYKVIGLRGIINKELHSSVKIYSINELINSNEKPDVVVMCHAAVASGTTQIESQILFEGNIALTEKLATLFPSSKLIYISTVSIYDQNISLINENSHSNPISEYAISKLWAEKIILKNEKSLVIRFPSLYGIGMKENTLIPNYINQALKEGVIDVWGEGKRYQNYLHVHDASTLIKSAIEKADFENNIFLGSFTEEYSNNEIAKIISTEIGVNINYTKNDNSTSLHFDNSITRKKLQWEPVKKIKEEIIDYIQWKRKQF